MTFEIKVYGMSYQAFNINGEQYLYGQYTGAYSIVNPNLYGSIYNLHDLNDFDVGYSKHNDNGSIIEQVRVNYHGNFIEYDYSLEPLAEYGASIIFDTIADTVPGLNAVGNVYGFFNALVSGENVQVKDIEANPEDNIFVNEQGTFTVSLDSLEGLDYVYLRYQAETYIYIVLGRRMENG